MEGIQDRVNVMKRHDQLYSLVDQLFPYKHIDADLCIEAKNTSQVAQDIQLYIAQLVENAYIAGANNVGEGEKHLVDTGMIKVAAGNYCKNKGLKI